jgi:hypothetical protein
LGQLRANSRDTSSTPTKLQFTEADPCMCARLPNDLVHLVAAVCSRVSVSKPLFVPIEQSFDEWSRTKDARIGGNALAAGPNRLHLCPPSKGAD